MLEGTLEKIGPEGLEKFAQDNPSAFFQICGKLIPSEISAALTVTAPTRTDQEAKAELTKLYSEDLACLMVGDITEEQYTSRIAARKGLTLAPLLEAKSEKEQDNQDLLEMNPEPTTH